MFAASKWKVVLALSTAGISFSPLLYSTGPDGLGFVTVLQLLWLPMMAGALGLPVTQGGGVDAFSLAPLSSVGSGTIVIGAAVSLSLHYVLACFMVAAVTSRRPSGR